jgi:hypothetical protein
LECVLLERQLKHESSLVIHIRFRSGYWWQQSSCY